MEQIVMGQAVFFCELYMHAHQQRLHICASVDTTELSKIIEYINFRTHHYPSCESMELSAILLKAAALAYRERNGFDGFGELDTIKCKKYPQLLLDEKQIINSFLLCSKYDSMLN